MLENIKLFFIYFYEHNIQEATLISSLFLLGISVEAITGALAAGKHKMDLFGVMFIALVTAIGGGSIRDVLLGNYPLTWVANPIYVLTICFFALATTRIPRTLISLEKLFLSLDALGLVVFSIVGVQAAFNMDYGFVVAICSGCITGIFGGILRDIFCNQIPLVFQKEIYAGVSIFVSALYYVLEIYTSLDSLICVIITLIIGTTMRLFAIINKLGLPIFNIENDESNQSE